MKKEVITSAKSIEEAVAQAVAELGAPSADAIEYPVLEEPKKGLFGIGATNAKISATYTVGGEVSALAFVKQLLSDTLRYGEAAQIYASYKLDSLATSHVTNMLDAPAFDVDNVGKLTTVLDGEYVSGAKWRSATLVLGSSMAIRYTFTAESLDGVSVACSNGQTYTSFASATDENGAAYYYFDVPVAADQFDTTFTVSFDGVENYSLNYSVNHYIAKKYDASLVKTAALLEAIYNYGAAADAYVAAASAQ